MSDSDHTTREAIRTAAATLTLSRTSGTRQSSCDFLNSHRDGVCAKCLARTAHDRKLAADAGTLAVAA